MRAFVYTWFHSRTGKRGVGTIFMRSYEDFTNWLNKWNCDGLVYGWDYSDFN